MTTIPRPSLHDPAILAEVADALLDRLSVCVPPGERADWLKDLRDALEDAAGDYDGYTLGQFLDRDCGWDVDAELIEDLNHAVMFLLAAHDRRVREWVKANSVAPTLAVGDRVRWRRGLWEPRTGVITSVRLDSAQYIVQDEAQQAQGHPAHLGYLVPYVDAEKIDAQEGGSIHAETAGPAESQPASPDARTPPPGDQDRSPQGTA